MPSLRAQKNRMSCSISRQWKKACRMVLCVAYVARRKRVLQIGNVQCTSTKTVFFARSKAARRSSTKRTYSGPPLIQGIPFRFCECTTYPLRTSMGPSLTSALGRGVTDRVRTSMTNACRRSMYTPHLPAVDGASHRASPSVNGVAVSRYWAGKSDMDDVRWHMRGG